MAALYWTFIGSMVLYAYAAYVILCAIAFIQSLFYRKDACKIRLDNFFYAYGMVSIKHESFTALEQ